MVDTTRFEDRIDAAAGAGAPAIALDLRRLRRHHDAGETDEQILAAAHRHHVRIDEIWSLYGVLDHHKSESVLARADRLIEVADRFGARMIGAPADFDGDVRGAADLLARIAARARRHDLRVGIEPVAFTGLDDVCVAAEIVAAADCDNVGLVIDAWHFFRGRSAIDQLDRIPSGMIDVVQLNDGFRAKRDPDPMVEVAHHRPLPGTGEFPVAALVRAVHAHSPSVRWAVEVGTAELAAASPKLGAKTVIRHCHQFLRSCGIE